MMIESKEDAELSKEVLKKEGRLNKELAAMSEELAAVKGLLEDAVRQRECCERRRPRRGQNNAPEGVAVDITTCLRLPQTKRSIIISIIIFTVLELYWKFRPRHFILLFELSSLVLEN